MREHIHRAETLCELFQATALEAPDRVALRTVGGGVSITWGHYAARVRRIAAGLARLGVRRGSTVALMMVNRPEFNLVDTAALHLGGIAFSIYNTLPAEQIQYLFSNAENRVVVCEAQFLPRIEAARAGTAVEHVVCIDDGGLAALEATPEDPGFDATWRALGPDDVVTLIYTSGTTGNPKGVELTHANLLAELRALEPTMPFFPEDKLLSFLPAAHIADRWSTHYSHMAYGFELTHVHDTKAVPMALLEVRPTVFGTPPRLWERLKTAVELRLKAEPDEAKRQATARALAVGLDKVHAEQAALRGEGPGPGAELLATHAKLDELVLSKVRAAIGLDRVRLTFCGAAPIAVEVLEFYHAIGIPIVELWGMSETSCVATINPIARNKLGTVGVPVPGVSLKVASDGELLVKSALVMRGYRGQPALTAEAIDADGWLHTGDVVTMDDEGYVKIVDRKKELIINAAGKNMSPVNIETALKTASPFIGQAICVGDRRPYNVALLVLEPDVCAARGLKPGDPSLAEIIAAAVEKANTRLARVEQIKRYAVLATPWEPGGDELTPTMKLKRRTILAKYAAEIESLYL